MARTVFDVLEEYIDSDISAAATFLSGGGAKDFAAYKETVGMIRGLTSAKQYIQDLSRRMENDDD